MRNRRIIIVAACLLVAAGILLYFFVPAATWQKMAEKAGMAKASKETETAAEHAHGALPQAPPQEAVQAGEAPTVEITDDKRQMIGVKTVKVSVKSMDRTIRTVGRIEYDERKLATANTKVEGWIEKLYVDYTGRYVKKGEPLAEIYSPELVATQQEFINILRWAEQGKGVKDERTAKLLAGDAQAVLEAAKSRLRLWDISDEQIDNIQRTGKLVRTLTIHSPVAGYVVQKMALQGMRVMPGEKLFDVADLSTLWVMADIYEYELPHIRVGQRARIGLSYFPGKEFTSQVDYVYPALAGETRTARVRFTIPNPEGVLKPQMFTNVEIRIGLGKRLAVPTEAVIDTGVRRIVYVDKGDGYFEPREVMTGLQTEDFTEITRGLKAGDQVASSGNFLIDSEAQLRGVSAPQHKH